VDTSPEIIESFATATAATVREMASIEVVPGEPGGSAGPAGDWVAVLRLTGQREGCLALAFPRSTARALAERILQGTGAVLDDALVRDCLGELANVVAGQTKALLYGTPAHFTLATPTVTADSPDLPKDGWQKVDFKSEAGEFQLHLRPPA
jgi:chemotaxis protein CheX